MKKSLFVTCLLSAALLVGCATGSQQVQSLTTDQVDTIFKSKTVTQASLVKALGEPQVVKDGDEKDTKILRFIWARSRPSAKNFIPLNPIKEFPTTKKVLEVTVDKDGNVLNHTFTGSFHVYRVPLVGENSIHSMRALTDEELNSTADPEDVTETKEK